ncbi:MAG: hypothetical protein GY795_09645 [Desulfobacterales bacterium]|nr:hypothetical protein [Desulfobacterales bacterium]
MSIIEKLGIKELLCIPCSQIKPSESIEFSAVPHVQLKERERVYRKMIEALIEIVYPHKAIGSNAEDIRRINNICRNIIEKATGKTWAEIEELKE